MQLHQQHKDKGLEVITLNMEGEQKFAQAEAVLEAHNITVTNFCLAGGDSEEGLAVLESDGVLPAVNLYDRAGNLRVKLAGIIEDAELERHTETLVAGQ